MLRRLAPLASVLALALGCPADDAGTDSSTAQTTAMTGEPTTGAEVDLTCDDYCTVITTNCSGPVAQYGTDACKPTCEAFPRGTLEDMAGNTLGCRLYHAGAAATDPEMHCTHAGPGGASVCGDNCEGFCSIAAAACPGTFTDDAACMAACKNYDMAESYDAGDQGGNTFACRLYHLTVATTFPEAHCPHILPDSAPCGGP